MMQLLSEFRVGADSFGEVWLSVIGPMLRQYFERDGYLGAAANSGRFIISDNPEEVRFISTTL